MSHKPVRFPAAIRIRVPAELERALDIVAARECSSPADYVRRAIARQLHADGIQFQETIEEAAA